jgi:prepilin-type N-terminal cleavage/methylation domain-containing protein/prepilin-type processing-associated H-X9-DG protein
MKKLHAFTLIELLVVISIIAILAGFALPVFSNAIERARATTDQNNLMGIGKGVIMYLNDNDDSMFSMSATTPWPAALQGKYVPDWNTFRSPFDKTTASRPSTASAMANGGGTGIPVSYGLSTNVYDTFVAKWLNSASTVILAAPDVDVSQTGTVAIVGSDTSAVNIAITTPGVQNCGTHQARQSVNVLFGDGHVQQLNWNTTYLDNSSDLGQQRWNPMYVSTATNTGG